MWEQVDYISCTKNNNPYIVQFHLCYLNSTNSIFQALKNKFIDKVCILVYYNNNSSTMIVEGDLENVYD